MKEKKESLVTADDKYITDSNILNVISNKTKIN